MRPPTRSFFKFPFSAPAVASEAVLTVLAGIGIGRTELAGGRVSGWLCRAGRAVLAVPCWLCRAGRAVLAVSPQRISAKKTHTHTTTRPRRSTSAGPRARCVCCFLVPHT